MKQDDNEDMLNYLKDSLANVERLSLDAEYSEDYGAAIYGVQAAVEIRQAIFRFDAALATAKKIEAAFEDVARGPAPTGGVMS